MTFASWLGRLACAAIRRSQCHERAGNYIPRLELLEERTVPSSLAGDIFVSFTSPGGPPPVSGTKGANYLPNPVNKAFEIRDFSFGVENPTTIGSATDGAGSGKVPSGEIIFFKVRSELTFPAATGTATTAGTLEVVLTTAGNLRKLLDDGTNSQTPARGELIVVLDGISSPHRRP